MKHLHIVALFRFKENYIIDAIELLKTLVSETRKEEGCLQYDLIEDNENKGVFFIIEVWESDRHHLKHTEQEHLLTFRKNSGEMLQETAQVYKGFKTF